jgi:hypothetical protein
MSEINSKIMLTDSFNKNGMASIEFDLSTFINAVAVNDGFNNYITRLTYRKTDGSADVLWVTERAKWIREQHADYKAARDHEAAGQSTLQSKPLTTETIPPAWLKAFA